MKKLAADAGTTMVDPFTEGEDNMVKVPAVLPVHPKVGALFLDGLLPHGALVTAAAIRDANPTAPVATRLLVDFCLAAAMAERDSSLTLDTSVLGSNRAKWNRLDPYDDPVSTWRLPSQRPRLQPYCRTRHRLIPLQLQCQTQPRLPPRGQARNSSRLCWVDSPAR